MYPLGRAYQHAYLGQVSVVENKVLHRGGFFESETGPLSFPATRSADRVLHFCAAQTND